MDVKISLQDTRATGLNLELSETTNSRIASLTMINPDGSTFTGHFNVKELRLALRKITAK